MSDGDGQFIYCPECGKVFIVKPVVQQVTMTGDSLLVSFMNQRVAHKCQ